MGATHSVKSKLMLLAAAGLLGFAIYLISNVYSNKESSNLVTSIATQEFRAISIIGKLNSLMYQHKSLLIDAVDFEDEQIAIEADSIANRIDEHLVAIANISPTFNTAASKMSVKFSAYHQHSKNY